MYHNLLSRITGLLFCAFICAQTSFGTGNPVLLVGGNSNPFSTYTSEILKAEGVAFDSADLSTVSAGTLAPYDVVVLGQVALSAAQVTTLTTWVNGGGRLIALRPDKQLASLLGLTDTATTLDNGYLLVNTAVAPGAGIVSQTIQFHGSADLYNLNGATTVATLYSSAAAPTSYPAVSFRADIGSGGMAAAFTYDLARSVVYTRQGNPAWVGQARVQQGGPIRAGDMFYGPASFDSQPDWVDLNKVAIPQADEQQRLLVNLILRLNQNRKPIPRFWYLPFGKKAAVVMTGDDHGNNGTAGRFDYFNSVSPAGCSLANWECVRASSYVYPNTPLSNTQAASYVAQGFEVGLHTNTGCADYTPASIETFYATELADFATAYPSIPAPVTNRTHCIAWSDWDSQALASLAHGIRLDTNYYYWPPDWAQDRPGFFTGSGIPMRFAQQNGTTINVYQAATQLTDESGQTFPLHINSLLDGAIGPNGYYGVFTANMHTDFNTGNSQLWSEQIVASAQARGVPVVSAKQMLQWLDGRDASSFSSLTWTGNTLTFNVSAAAGANGLQAMLPSTSTSGSLNNITQGGTPVVFTLQTIKGIEYAFFTATSGAYVATYTGALPPVITSVAVTPGLNSATVTWTTDRNSSSRVDYGTTPSSLNLNISDSSLVSSHSIALPNLAVATLYYYRVTSVDSAGLSATSPVTSVSPASFSTIDTIPPVISAVTAVPALGGSTTITWTTNEPSTSRVDYGTSQASLTQNASNASMVTSHTLTITGLTPGATYFFTVASADSSANSATSPVSPATPYTFFQPEGTSVWGVSATPTTVDSGDPGSVELGMKFRSDLAGAVTAIRFYKALANTGTHTGHLWSSTGTLLGTVTFSNETASGWQQANFTVPVTIAANTTYIVSYFAPVGHYSANSSFFATGGVDTPPLHALAEGVDGGNGVYSYGATSAFPNSTYLSSNYWVDVVFTDSVPVVISALQAATAPTSATITWTTNVPSNSRVDYGTSPTSLTLNASNASLVASHIVNLAGLTTGTTYYYRVTSVGSSGNTATSPDATSQPATFIPATAPAPVISALTATPGSTGALITWTTDLASNSRVNYGTSPGALTSTVSDVTMVTSHSLTLNGLTASTTYYYQVVSTTSAGGSATSPVSAASFVTTSGTTGSGSSIWSPSAIPTNASDSDTGAVELGMKFRSDISGYVTGVRFYKAATNTGSHIGNLWSSTGVQLGTVTFANETASGWQQANFPAPIPVTANTTYIISYFAPNGRYAGDVNFFSASGVDAPPLHALQNGVDGPNGVYRYASISGFPNSTYSSTNYWVDLVFVSNDGIPPTVTNFTLPATSSSLVVPITNFTATDNIAVAGYLVTESVSAPLPSDSGWSATAPISYGFASAGNKTVYAWAKDSFQNVSASRSASVVVTLSDTTAPTVTTFTIPATATSLTIPITSLTATDNIAVTGYLVNESAAVPAPAAAGWSATVPASYTFTTSGIKTLYAWAKDAAGNVSTSRTSPITITLSSDGPEPEGWYSGDMHVHRSCGGSPEALSSLLAKMGVNNLAAISLLADNGNGEVQTPATDLPLVTGQDDSISTPGRIVHWDVEWHWDAIYTQYPHQALGGHLVALGLNSAQQIWEESTYSVLNWARAQNGIAGFAHMQYLPSGIPDSLTCCTPIEYPVEVALGAADFISEDVDDSGSGIPMNPDNFIQAYYKLLNTGFRPGFAAGTDYPCNSARPLGALLTYAQPAGGQMTYRNWIEAIKNGRTVVSRNGHNEFLNVIVNGTAQPGDQVNLASGGSVGVTVQWSTAANLSGTLELVSNGVVVASSPASASQGAPATWNTTVNFPKSGWLAARRMGADGHQVHTAAAFVIVNGAPIRASVDDAQFYVDWMDSLLAKTSPGGEWNSFYPTQLALAQSRYQQAKTLFQQIATEAAGGTTTPSLTSINPASGVLGSTVAVTVAGTNLTGATLNLPAGITLNGTPVVTATQITANLVIASNATTGAKSITVTTSSATSNAVTFTVNNLSAPTLTGINPASGAAGATIAVAITGTGLTGATLNLPTGITASGSPTVTATQITATLVISSGVTTGGQSINVTTPGGTSNSVTFTIVSAPSLTSISPSSGASGATIPVTLTGSNLTGATLNLPTGITLNGTPVVTAAQITANLVIASSATTGARSITVTAGGSTSNSVTFTVLPGAALSSISPSSGARGATIPVTITGTNLTGATVNLPTGITLNGTPVVTATQITANLVIASNATTGARSITVTAGGSTSNSVTFTVASAPTLSSISPSSGALGATIPVTINGSNLISTTLNLPAGITLNGTPIVTATQITANLVIASNATTGAKSITVTTGGSTSNSRTFTVASAPTLTSISPTSGVLGATIAATINGTNLIGTTLTLPDGITLNGTPVVTATRITASLVIASGATTGAKSITVTTGGSTSNSLTFTVRPPAPTLASISPSSGARGTTVPVTITGANLTGATLNLPSGITRSGALVVTATQITATLVISTSATTGGRSISVTTSGGTSNTVTFTVTTTPVITSISPSTLTRGTATTVTINGFNFTSTTTAAVAPSTGITVGTRTYVNSNQIRFLLTVASGATTGNRALTVTRSGQTSNAATLTIQ